MTENVIVVCTGEMYTISFDIVGGEAPYSVNSIGISGSTYTSGLIDDDPYIFVIRDNHCAGIDISAC